MKYRVAVLVGLALLGCTPDGADPSSPPDPVGPPPDVSDPGAPVLRRLTASQYDHALHDLFGDDIYVPTAPEPDLRLAGMARIGASSVAVSARGVERYEAASYTIAAQALDEARRGTWMPCEPTGTVDDACAEAALAQVGRLAWRRPLTDDELAPLVEVSATAADTLGDFHAGLEFGIAAVLQSPDFLMRPEVGEEDPEVAGARRYTAFELAERLSFMLWDSIPDDALLAAAEAGDLDDPEGLAAEVDRMIADPRARRGLRAWTDDLLDLQSLFSLQKDPTRFVNLSAGLFGAMREETLLSLEDLTFDRQGDLRDWMTGRRTWLDRDLATLYGVQAPARDGFGAADLPSDGPRAGLLGNASILARYAHPTSSSATLRGKFVRTTLLCQVIPPPPTNVDTSIPEASADAPTLRDRIAAHLENPTCAGCHKLTDPIGLGLEQFDGLGGYRTTEAGVTIDVTGDLDGAKYDGMRALAEQVRGHDAFIPCMIQQVTRAAIGRTPDDAEDEAMAWLAEKFVEDEYRLTELWRALALSPLFRRVGEVSDGEVSE